MRRKVPAWRMAALLAAVPVAASMAALPAGTALAGAAHSTRAAVSASASPGLGKNYGKNESCKTYPD